MKDNIALIGFMGSGKSTIGRVLAKYLDMKFIDIDKMISAREKKQSLKYLRKREKLISEN